MKFVTVSKFLMVIFMPLIIILLAVNISGFNDSFYMKEFSQLGVQNKVPSANAMHEKVMDFIEGKSNKIPVEFNSRESRHLLDVRNLVSAGKILLYSLIILFFIFFAISSFILKFSKQIINFAGIILLSGGFLTLALAGIFLLSMSFDFSATFELFHKMLFSSGTYAFDPSREIIVDLYPEQVFADLGFRISETIFIISAAAVLSGFFLMLNKKNKKNKKKSG